MDLRPPQDLETARTKLFFWKLVAVVTVVLLVLFLSVGGPHPVCLGRQAAAMAMARDLQMALRAFKEDYGVYPADLGGTFELKVVGTPDDFEADGSPKKPCRIIHLFPPKEIAGRPKARPYYEVKTDDFDPKTGILLSPLGRPFYYQEWASKPGSKSGAKNPCGYDLWTADCDTVDHKGPGTGLKEAPHETRVRNW